MRNVKYSVFRKGKCITGNKAKYLSTQVFNIYIEF